MRVSRLVAGSRMVCTRSGMIGADVRPDWSPVLAQNWRDGHGVRAGPCSLSSSALIAVVQTANFREGNDIAGRGRLYGTRPRAVLAE
jgi:hypothetical protein